jgi:methyl-accepting chemotaxis protein
MSLQGIRIWHKLLLLGLITLLLCAVPTALFVRSSHKDIRAAQLEIAGLAPTEALVRVIHEIQAHRGLAAGVLSGVQGLDEARLTNATEVSDAIAQAQVTVPAHAKPIAEALRAVDDEWKSLATAVAGKNMPMEENYTRHSKVTQSALKALEASVDHFGLSLDPASDSGFLIVEAYQNLPRLAESIARLRAIGVAILGINQATAEERVTITALVERLREELDLSRELLKKAAMVNGAQQNIDAAASAAIEAAQKLVSVTDLEFVRIEVLRYDATEYLKLASAALDAQYRVIHLLHGEIQRAVNDRAAEYRRTMWLLLALVGSLLALGVVATYWIARSITRPLNAAVNDADAIAAGNLGNDIAAAGCVACSTTWAISWRIFDRAVTRWATPHARSHKARRT